MPATYTLAPDVRAAPPNTSPLATAPMVIEPPR